MTKKLKKLLIRIFIGAGVFAVALIIDQWVNTVAGRILYAACYLTLGYDVLKKAFLNIRHGHVFDENFLMTIASIGAFACGELEEAAAVMLFYQVGEWFQSYAVNKSRKSIKALMDIRPDFARVLRNEVESMVDPSEVFVGELILIQPGERIPLDGEVVDGEGLVDTAAITGESIPREVAIGTKVVSGCVNLSGLLTVKTTSTYGESTVSKVLSLVEDASEKKAKTEQFITVFARVYTPIVVSLALLLIIGGTVVTRDWSSWIYRGMTFLLISCPCALVISVPLSFFGGIGGAGRRGILIKGGNYMETLSKIDTLVLDKTGTITKGVFKVCKIEVSPLLAAKETDDGKTVLLRGAAAVEEHSTHPIAKAIVHAFSGELPSVSEVEEQSGKGVKAKIGEDIWRVGNASFAGSDDKEANDASKETIVYVSINNVFAGKIYVEDEVKEDTLEAIKACRKAGISRIVMLTGDREETAKKIAASVSLDEYRAEQSPLDKVSAVEELLSDDKHHRVCFVGDGINDAPVLARADLGIAMGAMGSDAAIEAADVVIMTDELLKIPEAKKIAKKTIRIVHENIVLALGVKISILILAAFGLASMWAAIFADVGVAFLAIMNALRALSYKNSR